LNALLICANDMLLAAKIATNDRDIFFIFLNFE